jgi:hypothetical protein
MLDSMAHLTPEEVAEAVQADLDSFEGSLDRMDPEQPPSSTLALVNLGQFHDRALPYLLETGQVPPIMGEHLSSLEQALVADWKEMRVQEAVRRVYPLLPETVSVR